MDIISKVARKVSDFIGVGISSRPEMVSMQELLQEAGEAPVEAGRSSRSEAELRNYTSVSSIIRPRDFDPAILQYIRHLAFNNRHVSKAVENIVNTAHTPCKLILSDYFSDRQKREMERHLEAKQSQWYFENEGESSLDADRFAQVAVFGACSTDAEIAQSLNGIRKIHRVSPEYIRWFYDRERREEYPVQLTTASSDASFAYTKLNPIQYDYIAYRRIGGGSYAVPPFLAALEDLAREHDMLDNFSSMMKRIGLLGFLSVMVEKPSKKPGRETDEQYLQRLRDYLKKIEPQVTRGFYQGYNIGYKGSHEFKLESNSASANGAGELMEMANKLVFAGLKQDPNLFGYNYSTTETFGKVIMEMMSKQAQGYQMVVAKDKANKACLELMLAGFPPIPMEEKAMNPYGLKYEFEKPLNVDKDKQASTEKTMQEANAIKVDTITRKRDEGYISQEEAARQLGHKKPNRPMPSTAQGQSGEYRPEWRERRNKRFREALGASLPEFHYDLPEQYDNRLDLIFDGFEGDEQLSELYRSYYGKVNDNYLSVWEAASRRLQGDFEELNEDTSKETVWALVEQRILEAWKPKFQEPNRKVIAFEVDRAYREYRGDQSIFSNTARGMAFADIPEASLDLLDLRAIRYLEEIDNLYLGKFITDEDTRRKFKTWLNEMFLDGNVPAGRGGEEISAFLEEFGEVFAYETYKIARVISTTLNKARNYANVLYINQANLEQFEIVEVMDRITCAWCRHINGKKFTTAKAVAKIERTVDAGTRDIGRESPFATSIPLEEFEGLDSQAMQNIGIDTPPYHCHCRGRVIAV